jgi:mediator of RNA polymerase II transcription subunit 14
MAKLGPTARGTLFIQLASFPSHYLVLVITDDSFRYALISVAPAPEARGGQLVMGDIGWLEVCRIHGGGLDVRPIPATEDGGDGSGNGRVNSIDQTEQVKSGAESR